MQHGYVAFRVGWIVGCMGPRIGRIRLWMPVQVKHFNNPFPYCLAVEYFLNRHAGAMRGLDAMQLADHVPQFINGRHAVASTRSPTVQKPDVTPAAIAGVQRRVPWRFT